jgi:cation diffusion facilitator CzcD-associated flavoprotein CzcO
MPPEVIETEVDVEALSKKYAEERAKRLRDDGVGQYHELNGRYANFDRDPNADPNFTRDPIAKDVDVLVIGGGFAGLLSGGRLREHGVKDICIIEKGADFGGTWYWNRYPGAACDVESYIYFPMLEETGYVPKEKYSKGPEIYEHCQRLAKRYDLYPAALFQTVVTGLDWDEARARWVASTDRGDKVAARFVISCCGFIQKPRLPGIPGIETYEGHTFHTCRWDYAYTGGDESGNMNGLADKVVGIIGTGATSIQAVPHLGESAKQLYVFQRTPASVDIRANKPTDFDWAEALKPGWQRERILNFTTIMSGAYQAKDMVDDGWTDIIRHIMPDPLTAQDQVDWAAVQKRGMGKMERTRQRVASIVKDPTTAEALKPYYYYLCKRPCFHDEYLDTFNRPNVELVDTMGKGVERITPKGVVVGGKEYKLDCLIFATGFDFMQEYTKLTGFEIHGRGGLAMSQYWAAGAKTLFGHQSRGFPNLFMLSVVQATATYNYLHVADEQARHLSHVVSSCLAEQVRTIEPAEEDQAAWIAEIEAGLPITSAFQAGCPPSAYNYDGKVTASVHRNGFHPHGPLVYMDRMAKWREERQFKGFERTFLKDVEKA